MKTTTPVADFNRTLPFADSRNLKMLNTLEGPHLYTIAASRPEWELVSHTTKLIMNTTATSYELRNLRIRDVILNCEPPCIVLNADAGPGRLRRTITLNSLAQATIELCLERARALGSHLPQHYIFPLRQKSAVYDALQPASASWLRIPFKEAREAADIPWLTPRSVRYAAIARLLQSGATTTNFHPNLGH